MLNIFTKKYPTGVAKDKRSDEEKDKDFDNGEFVSAPVIKLVSKAKADLQKKKYHTYNQNGTLSCVAHGKTLLNLIKTGFIGAPMSVYVNRSNFPAEGMHGPDAGNIGNKIGFNQYLDFLTPKTEAEANKLVFSPKLAQDALKHRDEGYINIYDNYFNSVASLASNGTAVMIFIYATEKEWAQEYPTLTDNPKQDSAPIRHAIVVLPNSVHKKDKVRHVIIQDSAYFGGRKHRYLSEDFINARCFYGQYNKDLVVKPGKKRPSITDIDTIKFGVVSPGNKSLQECLVYEGIHPADAVTGLFKGTTLKSVKLFQQKYTQDILAPWNLTEPTGMVGPTTKKKLLELYP